MENGMLKILSDGENRHRLEDSTGTAIGWIRWRTIGVRGFPTEEAARDATVAAWRALQSALRMQYPGWMAYEANLERLRSIHDGVHEWFHDGTTQIARLLRPRPRAWDNTLGIELVLPSYASEGVAMTVAHSVARATEPFREPVAPVPAA
jgi:hypothetical protein